MAELIGRLFVRARPAPGGRGRDLPVLVLVGGLAATVLAYLVTLSLQAPFAFVLVVLVVALHVHDRRLGIAGAFALWFLAPGLRRVLGLLTGYVENDPLSLAPFIATAAIAGIELTRVHVPTQIRRVLFVAAAGFAFGLPVGLVVAPQSAIFAFGAYAAGLTGLAFGLAERGTVPGSTLRRVLLLGLPAIAVYGIVQRVGPLPEWDREWIENTGFRSIGAPGSEGNIERLRIFATLNSPGTLAPLLGLALLCYLTIARARAFVLAGAVLMLVALSLTFVRSAWVALIAGGVAHVLASRGRSARLVFGVGAVAAATTLALAPVSQTARDVVDRFTTIGNLEGDTSATARKATFASTLPVALQAPLGHGLGSAGEPSKLSGDLLLRAPDNGYLSLMYQVGPVGFLLVVAVLGHVLRAAWLGAMARAPGQDMRVLVFAMLVFLLVLLTAGDVFYGAIAVILWFLAGQTLAFDHRRRMSASP